MAICSLVMAAPTCESEPSPSDYRQSRIYRLEAASDELMAESLSERNLEAFEFRAVQKLMDYSDHLGIIYSEGYVESFRQQARQNISSYFNNSENAEIALNPDIISGSYNSFIFEIDSIDIIEPLQRETGIQYKGSMKYVEKILGVGLADTTTISRSSKTIEIVLQMDYKDFGEQSLLVWEILLGEITPVD
jgi:hypothetical protein